MKLNRSSIYLTIVNEITPIVNEKKIEPINNLIYMSKKVIRDTNSFLLELFVETALPVLPVRQMD